MVTELIITMLINLLHRTSTIAKVAQKQFTMNRLTLAMQLILHTRFSRQRKRDQTKSEIKDKVAAAARII